DDAGIFLGDKTAADLAGARDLGVVGFKLLVEQKETTYSIWLRQRRVYLGDFLHDQRGYSRFAAEVNEARIGQTAALRPAAGGAEVDGNHRGHERSSVAERDSFPDERTEFQLVLGELR